MQVTTDTDAPAPGETYPEFNRSSAFEPFFSRLGGFEQWCVFVAF